MSRLRSITVKRNRSLHDTSPINPLAPPCHHQRAPSKRLRKILRSSSLLLVLIVPVLLNGCAKSRLTRKLDESLKEIEKLQETATASVTAGDQQSLTWDRAVRLMTENNLGYQQARNRLDDLEEDRRQFYWQQLSPRLLGIASLSSALGDISNLSDNAAGVRLFGSIAIPEPVGLYARRYSLELQYYQASLDLELLKRRLHASLYGSFLTQRTLNLEEESRKQIQAPITLDELLAGNQNTSDSAQALAQQQKRALQLNLNNLLQTPGQLWTPLPATMPQQSYRDRLAQVTVANGYGRIALKQAAGQLESSLALLWQLKHSRLPILSSGVALPTLYDTTAENSPEIGDIRLFGSMNQSFDLTRRDARSARNAERRVELLKSQLGQRLEREAFNLLRAKTRYQELIEKEETLRKQLSRLRRNPPPAQPKLIFDYFSELNRIRAQLHNNQLTQGQLDMEFWIWDENYWGSPF